MRLPEWVSYIPEAIKAIAIAIPAVKVLVEQFETPGWGPEKKAKVIEALKAILVGFEIRQSIVDWVTSGIGGVIDAIVALKNIIGEFSHSDEAA